MPSYLEIGGKWRATVRLAGHQQQNKTFDLKSQAKQWAENLEHQLRNNKPITSSTITVGECIAEYRKLRSLAGREITKKSNTFFMLRHLEDFFGKMKASAITSKIYTDWVAKRLELGGGRVALGQELSLLRTVYKRSSAVFGIELPPHLNSAILNLSTIGAVAMASGERNRYITEEEFLAIYAEFKDPMRRDILELSYRLPLRQGEILNLRWKDFDDSKMMLTIRDRKHPRKKTGNTDIVPLLFGMYMLIDRQKKEGYEPDDKIFPNITGENLSDEFLKVCREKLIEDCHWHDLRHTSITNLFNKGLAIQQVSLLSGHKDWRHLKRYTHLNPEHLHTVPNMQE